MHLYSYYRKSTSSSACNSRGYSWFLSACSVVGHFGCRSRIVTEWHIFLSKIQRKTKRTIVIMLLWFHYLVRKSWGSFTKSSWIFIHHGIPHSYLSQNGKMEQFGMNDAVCRIVPQNDSLVDWKGQPTGFFLEGVVGEGGSSKELTLHETDNAQHQMM